SLAAAIVGLSAYGLAFADDSSMSMWTGDSYAYFNDLDYSAGHFNVARAPRKLDSMTAKASASAQDMHAHGATPAQRSSKGTATNPFRNDTGA
ncbi:MAG TPA: hypothetical protein VFO33_08715, partial [Casimicrobiaceae bacterium]|nr:hypothetical protein [Casimicrobiaceae bacterium]